MCAIASIWTDQSPTATLCRRSGRVRDTAGQGASLPSVPPPPTSLALHPSPSSRLFLPSRPALLLLPARPYPEPARPDIGGGLTSRVIFRRDGTSEQHASGLCERFRRLATVPTLTSRPDCPLALQAIFHHGLGSVVRRSIRAFVLRGRTDRRKKGTTAAARRTLVTSSTPRPA